VGDAELLGLLRTACKRHRELTVEAMRGRGVDRHMLGLRLLGLLAGKDAHPLFQHRAWQEPFLLSTSQTPLVQEPSSALNVPMDLSMGGAFGPVCEGGVGVPYFVLPSCMYWNISANGDPDGAPEDTPSARALRFGALVRETLQHLHAAGAAEARL